MKKTRKITYNKLVRDKIPEIIEEKTGCKCQIRILDEEEFNVTLFAKLCEEVEELGEALNNGDKRCIIDELADITTILRYLMKQYKIDVNLVSARNVRKCMENGEFSKRIFLESATKEVEE